MPAFFDWGFAGGQVGNYAQSAARAFNRASEATDVDARLTHLYQAQEHAKALAAYLVSLTPEVAAIVDESKGERDDDGEGEAPPKSAGKRKRSPKGAGHV